MWRFMEGVQNPPQKMKVDVDKHQHDSEYDRMVRTFQNSWKTGRPLLIFNKLKNVMTCSFCTDLAGARNENNSSASDRGGDGCIENKLLIKSYVISTKNSYFFNWCHQFNL